MVGHLTCLTQGLGLFPGGNGRPMKDEKDRVTGMEDMLPISLLRGNDSGRSI